MTDGSGSGGQLALSFSGPDILNLSGSNTYSGGTGIYGGTVQTASSSALGTGDVVLGGGTLDLDSNT